MRFETGRSFANEAQDDAPIAPNDKPIALDDKNEGENAKKTIPSLGKERVGRTWRSNPHPYSRKTACLQDTPLKITKLNPK